MTNASGPAATCTEAGIRLPAPSRLGEMRMFYQILSVVGAALILVAYAGNQRAWIGPESPSYNVMNLLGALLLLWVALVDRRMGFIVLEVVWAAVTLPPLWRSLARRRSTG